ncbi:hypothetical protein [Homoserinibacter sp. GY 40078]|uniref:hypothetical protein n=1 Tax=Homoserinibacter sp. GY 40078 TaxID=2603275 RepID=UPI0011C86217|nr:hypothetical protein [Homoserinibacter sp. GY 40078]TXK17392.1 hypothetical protein FVQ89_11195 [Homoserinibacter sp. GY 40078]
MSTESVADLVERLAVQDGEARPLLVQLRRACHSDIGGTAAGASSGAAMPIDPGAVDLWREIVVGDDEHVGITDLYRGMSARRPTGSAVVDLLAWSISFHAALDRGDLGETAVAVAEERLSGWVQRIRQVFDPRWQAPLRGFACPVCGLARVVVWASGQEAEVDAVVVNLEDGELVARCRNSSDQCGGIWKGDPQVIHMARQGGVDVEAIAGALREARYPTTTETLIPDTSKLVKSLVGDPLRDDPQTAAEISELQARRATRIIVGARTAPLAVRRAAELRRDGWTVVAVTSPRTVGALHGVVADRLELVHDGLTAAAEAGIRGAANPCLEASRSRAMEAYTGRLS